MMKKIIAAGFLISVSSLMNAQIDSLKMNLDLRTRGELDNGYKTLISDEKSTETTISSRVRLGIDYYYKNLEIYMSAQDVRTWGEASSTSSKNQNFTLNEAWAKYKFSEKFSLKLGRQILAYDNERLIGALDWAMQGRSFDALKGVFNFNSNSSGGKRCYI
ncbi:alginate export family protein [Chryseobacterium indoltheticum]|uniref:alginate export family protein n=1 Tax=Chryseobacterium indoltheticum TaxID=254 RepID=UPI003F495B4B